MTKRSGGNQGKLAIGNREQRAPKSPKVQPPKKGFVITPEMLGRAQVIRNYKPAGKMQLAQEMFKRAEPAPGVTGRTIGRHQQMAMDDALSPLTVWASQQFYNGSFYEGTTFLGYPYLATLAQRPEYRHIVETIAKECTRKWIRLTSTGSSKDQDKKVQEKIDRLGDFMDEIKVKAAFRHIVEIDGFFGRAHLYLDTGDTDDRTELVTPIGNGRNQITKAKWGQKKLKRLQPIEPVWCYPTNYNSNDPLKPTWYNPETWWVMGKEIHVSRLLPFVGREVPDLLKPAYSFGGLSMTQMAKPYVDNWLETRSAVNRLIQSFSYIGLKTNLQSTLQEGSEEFFKRMDLFNLIRTNGGFMAIDKDTEEFFNFNVPMTDLDKLQAQAQEHMASVSGIPLVKLLGIQPAGLNASSEGEIITFEENIHAYQEKFIRDRLIRVIDFSQLTLFGEVDPTITAIFEPLREMSERDRAEINKLKAETDDLLVNGTNAISPEEVRQRVAADEDSGYNGIDPDDMPEPPEPEPGEEGGNVNLRGTQRREPEAEKKPGAQDIAMDAEWHEGDHPRGQPGNSGQFGPGGSSSTGGAAAKKQEQPVPARGGGGRGGSSRATPAAGAAKAGKTATALFDEHARRVTPEQVMEAAGPGCRDAMKQANDRLAASVPTSASVADGGFMQEDGNYTPERRAIHAKIIESILTPEAIARAKPELGQKPTLTMLGGRGGSGKSWLTGPDGPVDASKSVLIDSDHIKSMLPGFENWNAAMFHEESTAILEATGQLAREAGLNVIYDATMKSGDSVAARIAQHLSAGYEAHGYYMFVPPQEAAIRAAKRFYKNGSANGRYVPPSVVLANTDNEKNFDTAKMVMSKWAIYDNQGAAPKLVSKNDA